MKEIKHFNISVESISSLLITYAATAHITSVIKLKFSFLSDTFQAEGDKVIYGLVHSNNFWSPLYGQVSLSTYVFLCKNLCGWNIYQMKPCHNEKVQLCHYAGIWLNHSCLIWRLCEIVALCLGT